MDLFVRNKKDEFIATVTCSWDIPRGDAVELPSKLIITAYEKEKCFMECTAASAGGPAPRMFTLGCTERASKLKALGGYLQGRKKAAAVTLADGSRLILSPSAPARQTDAAHQEEFSPDSPRLGSDGSTQPYDRPGRYGAAADTEAAPAATLRGAHYPVAAQSNRKPSPKQSVAAVAPQPQQSQPPPKKAAPSWAPRAAAEPSKRKALPSWGPQPGAGGGTKRPHPDATSPGAKRVGRPAGMAEKIALGLQQNRDLPPDQQLERMDDDGMVLFDHKSRTCVYYQDKGRKYRFVTNGHRGLPLLQDLVSVNRRILQLNGMSRPTRTVSPPSPLSYVYSPVSRS